MRFAECDCCEGIEGWNSDEVFCRFQRVSESRGNHHTGRGEEGGWGRGPDSSSGRCQEYRCNWKEGVGAILGLSSSLCEVVGSCCCVEASGKGDGERVECLFPALGPGAEVTSSVVSDVAYGEVEDLEYGVVSGEMPPGFRDFA